VITQEGVQFANSLRSASGYYLSAAAFVAWLPRLPVADKIAAYEAVAVVKRSDGTGSMYGDWMTHDQIYRCTFALCSRLLAQYRSRFEPDPDALKADAITYLHALEAGDTDAARRASAPYLPQSPVAASSAHVVELATAAAFTQALTETAVHNLRVIDGLVGERNGTHA
jgi:hypothetical protein